MKQFKVLSSEFVVIVTARTNYGLITVNCLLTRSVYFFGRL